MWRRIYLLLFFVRLYFALSPSYLHPDENFQGPEVLAGYLFPFPTHRTWEWTNAKPIRSVFPLWPVYGLPMVLLDWMWVKGSAVDPAIVYYTLRIVMFMFSFVLEDWAIHDLVHSPRSRKQAVVLVASSYVTWTFQTHTFSNSIETLQVLWSLVMIQRIVSEQKRSSIGSSFVLAFLLVFGTFNRITFPAFVMIPGIRLVPHFWRRPLCFVTLLTAGVFWTLLAIATDTAFYTGPAATTSFRALFEHIKNAPVITPINNLLYNSQTKNLAEHGLHPHYQHIVANLPQLLGPAFILILISAWPFSLLRFETLLRNPRLAAATTGTVILSIFPHQEPRFLLPCVPLLLSCLRLPTQPTLLKLFWTTWAIFNLFLGVLMGIYHQGGIIPGQIALPLLITDSLNKTITTNHHSPPPNPSLSNLAHNIEIFWWKTYPPPTYLLGQPPIHPATNQTLNISTVPLMGMSQSELVFLLMQHVPTCDPDLIDRLSPHHEKTDVYVAAPLSAWRLPNSSLPAFGGSWNGGSSKTTSGSNDKDNDKKSKHKELRKRNHSTGSSDTSTNGSPRRSWISRFFTRSPYASPSSSSTRQDRKRDDTDNNKPDSQSHTEQTDLSFTVSFTHPPVTFGMRNLAVFRNHINLDDLDFGGDGLWKTLERVVGRRGLGVWKVDRLCALVGDVDGDADEDVVVVAVEDVERGDAGGAGSSRRG